MIIRARSILPLERLLPRSRPRRSNQHPWSTDLENGVNINDSGETVYPTSSRGLDTKHLLNPTVEDFRAGLYRSLVQHNGKDQLVGDCWTWYCQYLEDTIKLDWKTILSPSIAGLDPTFPLEPSIWYTQLAIVYKVLEIIANAISSRGDVSLDGVIAELSTKRLLRADDPNRPLQDQGVNRQMIWCLSGTITMLHDPRRTPYARTLQLRQSTSSSRARGIRRQRDLSSSQQDITTCSEPFHSVLAQFGDLIPRVEADTEYLSSIDHDHINVAYINFYTLKHVAKLDIEWVNTMNLHLQLDKRKRTLRLYRFPAFCRLLWTDTEDSFMQNLLADHCKSQVSDHISSEHTFSDFLRELILTYRLLFGISKKAQKAFKAELENWGNSNYRNDNETSSPNSSSLLPQFQTQTSRPDSAFRRRPRDQYFPTSIPPPLLSLTQDPLLTILSTTDIPPSHSSTSQSPHQQTLSSLLTLLHGEEKSTHYDLEDFPFLGRRLADLQRFSLIQKPNDLLSIFWIDRRDTQNFWNSLMACALLFIGGGTIILQFFQLVFQIWGTVMQFEQT